MGGAEMACVNGEGGENTYARQRRKSSLRRLRVV